MDCIHTLFLVSSFLFCHTDLTDLTDLYSYDDRYIVGRILKAHFHSSSNNQTTFIPE